MSLHFRLLHAACDVAIPAGGRARELVVQRPDLPLPEAAARCGGGRRWRHGGGRPCLAKVLEAHYDAQAIIAELNAPALAEGQLLAVWAAEGPKHSASMPTASSMVTSLGCSGSAWVDAALVTVRNAQGVWLCQVAAKLRTLADEPGRPLAWPAFRPPRCGSTAHRWRFWERAMSTRSDRVSGTAVRASRAVGAAAPWPSACGQPPARGIARDYWVKWTSPWARRRRFCAKWRHASTPRRGASREEVVRLRCVVERARDACPGSGGARIGPGADAWRMPTPSLRGPDRVPSAEPRRSRLGMAGRPAGEPGGDMGAVARTPLRGRNRTAWLRCDWLWQRPATSANALCAGHDRVVVVAPHPDDEILGCGGLLRHAAEQGMEVRVVAVTDGETCYPDEHWWTPERLRSARRAELAALGELGIRPGSAFHLGIADGAVSAHEQGPGRLAAAAPPAERPGPGTLAL